MESLPKSTERDKMAFFTTLWYDISAHVTLMCDENYVALYVLMEGLGEGYGK